MRPRLLPIVALAAAWLAAGTYCLHRDWGLAAHERPASWATRVRRPGLPNLHRVTDALYRGAQPTPEGFRELKKMGVKSVINLRSHHSDDDELGDTGLAYEEIPMSARHAEADDAVRFLRLVTDKARTPVFVHCKAGADRTGAMCALYRIVVQGWTKDAAIREMTRGGFGHHPIYRNLPKFIEGLDVEALRKQAGLPAKP
ncbi:MAG: protein tyrosine phosphatase [Planctomycetes bacterium]|nr:protein tyrosine phosphatase [Planctomycetota bacterium]